MRPRTAAFAERSIPRPASRLRFWTLMASLLFHELAINWANLLVSDKSNMRKLNQFAASGLSSLYNIYRVELSYTVYEREANLVD